MNPRRKAILEAASEAQDLGDLDLDKVAIAVNKALGIDPSHEEDI